jgi:hypothetical protein
MFDFSADVRGDTKAEAERIERAVVLVGDWDTRVIFGRGWGIESDADAGLGSDEAGPTPFAPEEKGLWIWEGIPGWRDGRNWEGVDEGAEPLYEGRGVWRRPTDEEALKVARGDFSFFGEEWLYRDSVEATNGSGTPKPSPAPPAPAPSLPQADR